MGREERPRQIGWLAAGGACLWLVATGCSALQGLNGTKPGPAPADKLVSTDPRTASQSTSLPLKPIPSAPASGPSLGSASSPADTQDPAKTPQRIQLAKLQEASPVQAEPARQSPPPAPNSERIPLPRVVPSTPRSPPSEGGTGGVGGPPTAPHPPQVQQSEPGTLRLDDVDVRKVLEILSREGSLNILISPNVGGRVTASLKGLSPEQALDAIVKLANLVAFRENGVIYVYTREEQNRENGLPLRVYHLNYIRSADVATMVKPLLSERGKMTVSPVSGGGIQAVGGGQPGAGGPGAGAAGGGPPGGGGSPAGGGGLAGGSDTLAGGDVVVIQDRESVLQCVDQLIAQLDVPPLQVLIEAVIVSVELDKNREFGVNFGVVDTANGYSAWLAMVRFSTPPPPLTRSRCSTRTALYAAAPALVRDSRPTNMGSNSASWIET